MPDKPQRIYLMRHCDAEPGAQDDATRGLTPKGWKDAKRVGKWLRKSGIEIDLILSSPYARAEETVERVQKGLHDHAMTVVTDPDMCPNANVLDAATTMRHFTDASILVVTHHPLICTLLRYEWVGN